MKLSLLLLILSVLPVNAFPQRSPIQFKKVRVNYKLVKKNASRTAINRVRVIFRNQDEIVDRSVSLFYDNMLTDLLGIAKVYNIINDEAIKLFLI